ncbi:MAG: hypothetical protein INH43_11355 [Acidobacteriaceae bacterium]|jgi:hypothetical protein|nr:hypothetical protein [Acidobacteriaceae bacterium]
MPGFLVRQTLLAGLIVVNLLLLILSIDWLLFEPIAASLFLLLLVLALLAIAVTGLLVTAGSRYTRPYRAVMGYLLWAPNRASRFSAHFLGLLLLLATLWLTVPRAIFRLEVNCQSAPAVSAAGFLGRIVRIPCAEQRATVQLYQPFRTLDFAKDRVSCVDAAGALYPAASEIGPAIACRNSPSRATLRIDRLEPPVIEANHIRRYRLHGAGLTKDLSITLDAPSFVGSSLSRDSDQHPVEVDPNGQWADVFLSVMPVANRAQVSFQLANESNQTAAFTAPVQVTALR